MAQNITITILIQLLSFYLTLWYFLNSAILFLLMSTWIINTHLYFSYFVNSIAAYDMVLCNVECNKGVSGSIVYW